MIVKTSEEVLSWMRISLNVLILQCVPLVWAENLDKPRFATA